MATKAFANGPPAIVRVEHAARPGEPMKQPGVGTAMGAAWTLQAAPEPLRALAGKADAAAGSGAPHGAVDDRTESQGGVTQGFEIKVRDPVMFTVSLKEAGVEKARAEAKAWPGAQRV